jgi:Protein of unknown function (DUF2946)
MTGTSIAGFRGADGRSLARCLALLLVVVGCLGAFHSGRMAAAAADGFIICSTNGAAPSVSDNPTPPSSQDHCICCAFGCSTAAHGVLAGPYDRELLAAPRSERPRFARTSTVLSVRLALNAGPRGPPVLT